MICKSYVYSSSWKKTKVFLVYEFALWRFNKQKVIPWLHSCPLTPQTLLDHSLGVTCPLPRSSHSMGVPWKFSKSTSTGEPVDEGLSIIYTVPVDFCIQWIYVDSLCIQLRIELQLIHSMICQSFYIQYTSSCSTGSSIDSHYFEQN